MTVGDSIAEPLVIHNEGNSETREQRATELLREVGLSPDDANKYPHQFSGGQQQRIGIARALALNPDLIIADEPVSSLNMSEQARILNLLDGLQDERDISYLFIAHDLNVVRHVCDRVGVMYLCHLMEVVPTAELFEDVRHPYSHALLSATPPGEPDEEWDPIRLNKTKIPDPVDPPAGCNFCTRCPIATDRCFEEDPPLNPPGEDDSRLSAYFYPNWLEEGHP